MPKEVDHDRRRRELAEAICRVVAREGVEGASLKLVSQEAGWSIGSMRHYFASKDESLVFAVHHVGDRIGERIERLPTQSTPLAHLREVVAELLPLDASRRQESLVWLAFTARAAVDPGLAPAAEDTWRQIHDHLVHHLKAAVESKELPAHLDAEREAGRLQALMDGLVVHLLTAPTAAPPDRAVALIDDHLTALHGPDPVLTQRARS